MQPAAVISHQLQLVARMQGLKWPGPSRKAIGRDLVVDRVADLHKIKPASNCPMKRLTSFNMN